MSTASPAHAPAAADRLIPRLLHPPVREARFWIVQGGVVTLAALHDVVLGMVHARDVAGLPAPATSALLLVPVIYAALNFGVRGAVGTALWATLLIVPHWFVADGLTSTHVWSEIGYLLVLNAVAVVVGQRVEQEQHARHRAEDALRAARDAEVRYRTLFEDQPSPVLLSDTKGMVIEANGAALRLLGRPTTGRELADLLGLDVDTLLEGGHPRLKLTAPDGADVHLVPTAHRLVTADGTALVQVVLSDITEEHRRQEEQRMLGGRLLSVQEEERRRLARELHDDPLQHLTYLTRTLDDLSHRPCSWDKLREQLSRGAEVADEAAIALRKIIQGLRPPVLDDLGLVSALRQLTMDTRTDAAITFKVTGTPARLAPDLELTAYRIAQEALTNIARHAQASRATVRLSFTEAQVSVTVTDDGTGVEERPTGGQSDGRFGLRGMQERVKMVGGDLQVSARRPHGTRVHATLPLTETQAPPIATPPGPTRAPSGS